MIARRNRCAGRTPAGKRGNPPKKLPRGHHPPAPHQPPSYGSTRGPTHRREAPHRCPPSPEHCKPKLRQTGATETAKAARKASGPYRFRLSLSGRPPRHRSPPSPWHSRGGEEGVGAASSQHGSLQVRIFGDPAQSMTRNDARYHTPVPLEYDCLTDRTSPIWGSGRPRAAKIPSKKVGKRSSPSFWKVSRVHGAAQTPKIDDFRSVKNSFIKNPGACELDVRGKPRTI